ncbi:MAG: hypothetical protein RLZZ505_1918 [Verrucomicrobiota bacterium]
MPPTFPPQAPATKGMSAMAWVGIGCGGLLVIALALGVYGFFIAKNALGKFTSNPQKAAAEFVLSRNPAFEMVSQDDAKGTMTIRTKDGEEMTVSYKDIAEGKITLKDKDGNVTQIGSQDLSAVPGWVPKPADLSGGVSLFHTESATEVTGQFAGKSSMDAEAIIAFYESEFHFTSASGGHRELNGIKVFNKEFRDGKRQVAVVATEQAGQPTQVNVNYSEKK